MDTQTAFATVTLMMLITCGILGLLYRELPQALGNPARSWLNGTLLVSAGGLTYVLQELLPLPVTVLAANGSIILGFTSYWRSLRQFYNDPPIPFMLLPTTLGVLALFWYSAIYPHTGVRIFIISVVWTLILGGCLHTLLAQARRDQSLGRRVLILVIALIVAFTWFRTAYLFIWVGLERDYSVVSDSWMNLVTPMLVAILPVVGTTVFVLMCSERLRRQWERAASTDFLTGLANRRSLASLGSQRMAERASGSGRLAVAVIDIDHFKAVNDAHGHEIGDVALRHVARVLQDKIRYNELAARLGGEEFVVLLDNVDATQALHAGERLRRAVEEKPFRAGRLTLPLSVSVGIAVQDSSDTNFDALLQRADQAMYAAKQDGRNRVVVAEAGR